MLNGLERKRKLILFLSMDSTWYVSVLFYLFINGLIIIIIIIIIIINSLFIEGNSLS